MFRFSASSSKEAIERLKYMEKSDDGFEISTYDLQMRGPGEVLGDKQSGLPTFLIADIFKDFPILQIAREDAMKMIEDNQKGLGYSHLIEKIKANLKVNNEYVD